MPQTNVGTSTSVTSTSGPTGVLKRGADSVGRRNEYAVEGKIAEGILAHYLLKARLARTLDRSYQGSFKSKGTDNGDTLTLRRLQTYGVQGGLATWRPQRQLQELVTLKVSTIRGIQTYQEWNDAGLYGNEDYEMESEMARNESITYGIESDCAQAYERGLATGFAPTTRTFNTATPPVTQTQTPAPMGRDNESGGTWPDNKLMSFLKSELEERGMMDRTLHAVLDTATSTSMGRTALFTQQFKEGNASATAQRTGSLDGETVAGWKISNATLNGRFEFGRMTGQHLDVRATLPSNGDDEVNIRLSENDVVKAGTVVSFQGVGAINTRTLQPLGTLAQFIVTEDETGSSTNVGTLKIHPPMRWETAGNIPSELGGSGTDQNTVTTAYRRRNVTGPPTVGAHVYIMEPGVRPDGEANLANDPNGATSTAGAAFRTGFSNAQVTRSFMLAENCGIMIFANPRIDGRSNQPYQKISLDDVGLELCIAIDSELAPQGGGTNQGDARPGMLTLYQAWTRIGIGVPEWEMGAVVTGRKVN